LISSVATASAFSLPHSVIFAAKDLSLPASSLSLGDGCGGGAGSFDLMSAMMRLSSRISSPVSAGWF
jgi:hypothetical protein